MECKVVQRKAKGKIRTYLNTLVGQRPRADIQVAYGKIPHVPRGKGMHARKISFVGGVCGYLRVLCDWGAQRDDF